MDVGLIALRSVVLVAGRVAQDVEMHAFMGVCPDVKALAALDAPINAQILAARTAICNVATHVCPDAMAPATLAVLDAVPDAKDPVLEPAVLVALGV